MSEPSHDDARRMAAELADAFEPHDNLTAEFLRAVAAGSEVSRWFHCPHCDGVHWSRRPSESAMRCHECNRVNEEAAMYFSYAVEEDLARLSDK